jgi:hypothetical protein
MKKYLVINKCKISIKKQIIVFTIKMSKIQEVYIYQNRNSLMIKIKRRDKLKCNSETNKLEVSLSTEDCVYENYYLIIIIIIFLYFTNQFLLISSNHSI